MPRLCYVIPETNMQRQHNGLIQHLADLGIKFQDLKKGDVVAFLNRKETMLRVLAVLPEKNSLGFVGTYKSPHGRVPLEAIQYITHAMGGDGFHMNKAIRMGLEKLLGKRTKARRNAASTAKRDQRVERGQPNASNVDARA